LKEEKQDPRKILFSENEENNTNKENLNSNIIISNTLLDSLCNQDNTVNNQYKEFEIKKDISHRSLPMNRGFNQNKRFLAFSRKNSICSNSSSVCSGLNVDKKNEIGKNDLNKYLNDKEKINLEEKEEIILSTNTCIDRRNSCNKIISEVRALYQSNFNCLHQLISNVSEFETIRKIPQEPERILDAPNLNDNFYYNPLDWGSKNILSVSLGSYNYLWNYNNLETYLLTKNENEIEYCSSSFMDNGVCLALGLNNGNIELWDIEKQIKIRTLVGHSDRVGTLTWNGYNLYSGSKDTNILSHDVRIKNHLIMKLSGGHNKEVCTIKWNSDFKYLASGGNDNLVCLWDVRGKNEKNKSSFWDILNSQSDDENENDDNIEEDDYEYNLGSNGTNNIDDNNKYKLNSINKKNNIIEPLTIINKHKGPVKALAWSPWQRNVLATGGGKKDNVIRFYNADTKSVIGEYNTGSQVCQILWNKYEKEIISSHGNSKNSICVWTYPKMNKIAELNGHLSRALYMAMSPDGCTLVSGSSDETLRFWNINERDKIKKKNNDNNIENVLSCFNSMMCLH
jgi:cell division cycle protein 20 (cofactor of APC complex)